MMKTIVSALCVASVVIWAGCSKQQGHEGHDHAQGHHHDPPHGGTAVELGDEACHLEFVFHPDEGRLHLYLLSAHMENFVRIPAETLELAARLPDRQETLVLKATANAVTGETVGNSSLFEAEADWLKTVKSFDATLKQIEIKGTKYEAVSVKVEEAKADAGHKH